MAALRFRIACHSLTLLAIPIDVWSEATTLDDFWLFAPASFCMPAMVNSGSLGGVHFQTGRSEQITMEASVGGIETMAIRPTMATVELGKRWSV